jgi:hypothetical protein
MAFLDHNGESEFPISKDKVFDAMCRAIPTIKGMKIDNADKLKGRIVVKAGVSIWSWGENIPVQLIELSENKTKVQITSSPKTGILFGGAMDMGKNRKNIENILAATSKQLTNPQIQPDNTNQQQIISSTNNFQTTQITNSMEQNNTSNAWYEKTWLVILLCVFFFPVGLYALWKNSTISKGWKIGVTIFFGLAVIANLGKDDKKVTETASNVTQIDSTLTTNSNSEITSQPETPKETPSSWSFSEDVDKMTSKKVSYASVTAKEELQFEFPYNGGSVATLTIRRKDGANNIYLQVTKGQFNSTYDGGNVRIKFDQNPPKRYSFSSASDASTDIIFINSTKDIISKLKSAKTLIIETEFYNEGNRQIEFDVSGFTWDK